MGGGELVTCAFAAASSSLVSNNSDCVCASCAAISESESSGAFGTCGSSGSRWSRGTRPRWVSSRNFKNLSMLKISWHAYNTHNDEYDEYTWSLILNRFVNGHMDGFDSIMFENCDCGLVDISSL